jgi:regulatory protein
VYPRRIITKEQALQKIKHYCSYQERCHTEVKQKLYNFGLNKRDVEEIIAEIIENDYLNEERFAKQFAGGKFRLKHWGRKKIEHELRQKAVSSQCIKVAIREIEEQDYIQKLKKLASLKWNSLTKEDALTRQAKTYAFLTQKGFELALIARAIDEIRSGSKK